MQKKRKSLIRIFTINFDQNTKTQHIEKEYLESWNWSFIFAQIYSKTFSSIRENLNLVHQIGA